MMRSVSSAPSGLVRFLGGLLLSGGLLLGGLYGVSLAQITLDGSLGPRGPLPGPHSRIPAEVGQIRGPNLFHSFGEFNVPTQGSATFTGPQTITNILSRVTGGTVSHIDGTLRSEIAGANLYLLNPGGVIFGPHARLDVSGSFHVSTADYLRLADGARFSARLSDTSTLSVAPPVAFGFLAPMPAAIAVQGSTLEVPEGQTLSMIGGDAQIVGGTLRAPSGRIQIASVAAAGEVMPGTAGQAPDLQVDSFAHRGRLEISQNALIDTSGNGGGTILIRGGRLLVDRSSMAADNQGERDGAGVGVDIKITADAVFTNGAAVTADSRGAGRARDLRLTGSSVHVDNAVIGSRPLASGDGGTVLVQVGTLTLTGGAQIDSSSSGAGRGGQLTVTATDAITIAGQNSQGDSSGLFSNTLSGTGGAGNLFVSAPHLEIAGGVIQAASDTASRGDAGAIRVEVGVLTLTGGAQIDSGTRGRGQGGSITVVAGTLTLAGQDQEGFTSGLFAGSASGSRGNAGAIRVEVGTLAVTDGAQISSSTRGRGQGGTVTVMAADTIALGPNSNGHISGLFNKTYSSGDAGNMTVQARALVVTGGAEISGGTESSGQGGTVTVMAADTIALRGKDSEGNRSGLVNNALSGTGRAGNLFVSAPHLEMAGGVIQAASGPASRGDAGAIRVEVGTLTLTDEARISSSTQGRGQGGTVMVMATDTITITGQNSRLATSTRGEGLGGDLTVQARQIQLTEGATITAESTGTGNAGNLTLTVGDTLLLRGHSAVTTAASEATGGNIRVTASSLVRLQDSQITATVGGGTGDGGNVTIDPEFLVLQGSQITANAVAGHGGRVSLTASKALLADPSSAVTASSTLGINGEVNIQAPVTNISGTLVPLPQAFARVTALLSTRCAERLRAGTVSSLVMRGRDGVPARPGEVVPLPLALAPLESAEEVGTAGPPEDTAASRVGVLQVDDRGQAQIRGWQGQGFVPAVLALECTK